MNSNDSYISFISFLKKNDCFDKFKNNWYSQKRYINGKPCFNLKELCDYCDNIINSAFLWSATLEGSDYWDGIYNLWREKLKKYYGSR